LGPHFGPGFRPATLATAEEGIIDKILTYIDSCFSRMKYVLGLGLDFAILAQRIASVDAEAKRFRLALTQDDLFTRYTLVTERGGKRANTLTLKYEKGEWGIRHTEEQVVDFFHGLNRTGYPSAYVYNTGQWQKYQADLLVPCFRLSESGRFVLCQRLIDYGLDKFAVNAFFGRATPRVRLYEQIITHYPRTGAKENAGVVLQGIAYGFFHADRPHLNLVGDKVRTGSARQRRFGDIDGYDGIDLELCVEVKDFCITAGNLMGELGTFMTLVAAHRIRGIVLALDVEDGPAAKLLAAGVISLTQATLLRMVALWDWRKQDAAVLGLLHYLAHVEQDPAAVTRLLTFIADRDKTHDSLAFRAL
jgi:hypothetical protein